jgi:hypothetical protein
MNFESFKASLHKKEMPAGLSENLEALWLDASGHWDRAHEIVQNTSGKYGDWIHAYLHRKEGDLSNAGYWYARCGRTRPDYSLDAEWEIIVRDLLGEAL